jgi:hypothetical protein
MNCPGHVIVPSSCPFHRMKPGESAVRVGYEEMLTDRERLVS